MVIYFVLQYRVGSLWLDTGKESTSKLELDKELQKLISTQPQKEFRIQQRTKNQYNPRRHKCC